MSKDDIQAKIEKLGIIGIEASGEFSKGLIEDAIRVSEKIDELFDFDAMIKDIDKKESQVNAILQ